MKFTYLLRYSNFDFNPPILTNTTENLMVSELPFIDFDKDGYTSDQDCDDHNVRINPSKIEVPNNNIDEDCSGTDLLSTSIGEQAEQNFQVYPNPVNDQLIVKLNDSGLCRIDVFDVTGKVLLNNKVGRSQISLNFHPYYNGVYYLQVTSLTTGEKAIKKVIKSN